MNTDTPDLYVRRCQAVALVAVPSLWLVMLAHHFRSLADFFVVRARYVAPPAATTVERLIESGRRHQPLHDPHLIGYLSLPLLLLAAFGLYALGRRARPLAALAGLALTSVGVIYLGGVFGLYTALFGGLTHVAPAHLEGASAAFAAVTSDEGPYGLTRLLARLTMVGLAVQGYSLWRARGVPGRAPLLIVAGCLLFLGFWDVDNAMFVGTVLLVAGFVPLLESLWVRSPSDRGRDPPGVS